MTLGCIITTITRCIIMGVSYYGKHWEKYHGRNTSLCHSSISCYECNTMVKKQNGILGLCTMVLMLYHGIFRQYTVVVSW